MNSPTDLRRRAAQIQLLLLDVDGVLTDGGLYLFGTEGVAVRFDVKDGLGLTRARRAGLVLGVVSARPHLEMRRRAEELGVAEVHLEVKDKGGVIAEILARRGLRRDQACYVGDDLVDLAAFEAVGLKVAVGDAVDAIRQVADYITTKPGGRGAVREVVDWLLAARTEEGL